MGKHEKLSNSNSGSEIKTDKNPLPSGFDVIDTYQNESEQALVDNLFDYFGKVYYKTADPVGISKKIKGNYYSAYDAQIHGTLRMKAYRSFLKALILALLFAAGAVSYFFFFGFDFVKLNESIENWATSIGWSKEVILYLIIAAGVVVALFGVFMLICFFNICRFFKKRRALEKRVASGKQPEAHDKEVLKNYPVAKKIRNKAVSKYDEYLFSLISGKVWSKVFWASFYLLLFVGGISAFYFLVGGNVTVVNKNITVWSFEWGISIDMVRFIVIAALCLIGVILLIAILYIIFAISWSAKRGFETNRVKTKVNEWEQTYSNFSNNLTKQGIRSAIQASMTELIFDKTTPAYDRKSYTLHNRIYTYSGIPQDARRMEFTNLSSGFYKGSPFNLSYSKWEWFREAKVVSQTKDTSINKVNTSVSRSLKRFEDSICVLTVDTFSEPKLNFVLKNPDGRNIKLQNSIFNDIFQLAVNNHKLAYKVFTPYAQHTISRCKTWSVNCKAIRQVIKEGTKLHVVFDGKKDFFNFDIITDPSFNHVFKYKDQYLKNNISERQTARGLNKRIKFGSLDETASLMVEYILEETDLLISSLEMAACLPMDDSIKVKSRQKTLFDVLEEKRLLASRGSYIKDITNESSNIL